MKELSLKANEVLSRSSHGAGPLLVDFKVEFGVFRVLGEELSPLEKAAGKKRVRTVSVRVWAT